MQPNASDLLFRPTWRQSTSTHSLPRPADAAAAEARLRRSAVRNGAYTLCIDVIFASLYEWPPAS